MKIVELGHSKIVEIQQNNDEEIGFSISPACPLPLFLCLKPPYTPLFLFGFIVMIKKNLGSRKIYYKYKRLFWLGSKINF